MAIILQSAKCILLWFIYTAGSRVTFTTVRPFPKITQGAHYNKTSYMYMMQDEDDRYNA